MSESPRSDQGASFVGRLARLRVPLGFLFGALALWLAVPTRTSLLMGAAIAIGGEALRVWAAGHLVKSQEVTSSGPYRWFAHPLYVGSSVMGVGVAIASASPTAAVLIGVYLAATITAAVRHEEAFLRGRFGDRYDRYRRGTGGRPLSSAGEADSRAFSVTQVMANREYRAAAGLLVAVLLLLLKATYNGSFWRAAGTHALRPGG